MNMLILSYHFLRTSAIQISLCLLTIHLFLLTTPNIAIPKFADFNFSLKEKKQLVLIHELNPPSQMGLDSI